MRLRCEEHVAERLGGRFFETAGASYKFARIKEWKARAIASHKDIPLIDLGVGEPDQPADPRIVEVLAENSGLPGNRFYADNGIPEFQIAAADYLKRVYGVTGLDPLSQILHGIGSKSILAMLPLGFINPGDVALTTVPGYPILATHTHYLGGSVYNLPLRPENGFLPDFNEIPPTVLRRAKLLYLNYPNNPTGRSATLEFYGEVIRFAERNGIVVVNDASYAALTLDGSPPLSFLSLPGASEVGVEVHSLSKAFNMTGWRLGFLAGNATVIAAYGRIKDNTDSGQFRAIQLAGAYALNHPELTEVNCSRYSRRFDLLVPALNEVGFTATKPRATFYCYLPSPWGNGSGVRFATAAAAAEFILREALISMVPWDDAGAYLRLGVTFAAPNIEAERQVVGEIKDRLSRLHLIF